jgi:hypothetical protein
LLFTAFPVFAQSANSGTVVGQVTDPSAAVVAGATVALIDLSTNIPLTTATNESGHFVLVNVPPGTYDVIVTKQGFDRARVQKQKVSVGSTLTENVKLKVGTTNEEIEVKASGTDLQTLNATVGNTVTGPAIDSLPSLGRDVSTFVTLQPGISPDGSVAGTVVDQSTFMLDGGNNTNDMDGSMSVYTPSFSGDPTGGVSNQSNGVAAGPTGVMPTPADSVEEFKVNTTNQMADFNSSSGAQVQVVTKRGTNTWHGSAYEYYLDNNLNANTYQNKANNPITPAPGYHYSRFGASFGGPLIPKEILGGKTYFFANYQGFRWPNSTTIERAVPSASMRLGLLYLAGVDAAGNKLPPTYYNLNPGPVTFNGVTYAGSGTTLDPRGKGINPLVQQLWNKYMPLPNETGCTLSRCDVNAQGLGNVGGFLANVAIPQSDNFGVFRLDHDFGSKWHFMSSYRYYKLTRATTDQVDIGGALAGDTQGVPTSLSSRPQVPWYLVAGLSTNITNRTTNDFHFSYLRNYWSWSTAQDVPQLAGLAGALEPFGETQTQALIPYNVNTQQTRTRFWDGHDWMFRDDVSTLHGNHLFQFGGTYQRNWNYHQRTDNGGGINYQTVYQLGTTSGAGIDMSNYVPPTIASTSTWGRDYAAALGIVSISQIAYTRTGPNLTLNPANTPASDKSTIPYYNVYFSDTWKMKPTFTLTYGLGWTLEMPPTEEQGKQIELVDASNQPIDAQAYLASRQRAALQGQVFNPQVGFALVGNTANGMKYPYNPYYGSFSPRIAAAWNPKFDGDGWLTKIFGHNESVIRGGYSRIFGRLNGVDLVLVPLLGTGLIQPVQCKGALISGGCSSNANPSTAFRIGVDGLTAPLPAASPTLPQPLYPGINGVAAGAGEALDPNFRPNVVDSITLTYQRQLNTKMTMEVGYIGRWIKHEYTPININAVPYMMTLGGQRFDKAYANVAVALGCAKSTNDCGAAVPAAKLANGTANPAYGAYINAIASQPFFEAAMKPTYCSGAFSNGAGTYSSCTAAVIDNELSNITGQNVWSMWSDLDNGGFNFARSMMNTPITGSPFGSQGQLTSGVGVNASIGYGNYNAGFVSLKMNDWKGLTLQSNFTWSKALGTGAEVQATSQDTLPDPYNLSTGYGLQGFDRKFVYNLFFIYQPPFYKSQQGFLGHVLGGWTIAPVFAAGTGLPITVGTANGGGQAFGEGDSVNFAAYGNSENAIAVGPLPKTGVFKTSGSNGVGTSGIGVNLFADPEAAFNAFRQPILGLDTKDGGFGIIRGLGYWNVDLSMKKEFKLTERLNLQTQMVVTNLFNHTNFTDPGPGDYLDTSSPASWGTLSAKTPYSVPRQMEFGIRFSF